MARDPIPTWCFALVLVRKEDRFLLVQECRHGQLWYLPAGRVEPGETMAEAALRETLEEAGISVRLVGVIRVEHSPSPAGARLRVVFLAEPLDNAPLKTTPDEESLRAEWVSIEELSRHPLRGEEVRELLEYVASGGAVHPMELLQPEGTPYPRRR